MKLLLPYLQNGDSLPGPLLILRKPLPSMDRGHLSSGMPGDGNRTPVSKVGRCCGVERMPGGCTRKKKAVDVTEGWKGLEELARPSHG
jgi:hypothetical protein